MKLSHRSARRSFLQGAGALADPVERFSSRPDFTDRSHVEPTVKFYLELESHHIPAEMHIYEAGPHGYARPTSPKPLPVMNWPERLKDWLAYRNISK